MYFFCIHFIKLKPIFIYLHLLIQCKAFNMTDLFKNFKTAWQTRSEYDRDLSFYTYIVEYSSPGEIDVMFCAKRDEMNASPCCPRHSGLLPISVNSMQNTPFVGGFRCDRQIRQDMRMLRRAFIALTTGQPATDFRSTEPDEAADDEHADDQPTDDQPAERVI